MTSVAVGLALVRWRPGIGGGLAVLGLASGWSWAAGRSGHPRVAYYLAAAGMGPVVLLVILLPFLLIVIGEGQLPADPETEWFLVFATLDCTVASLVCVRILRSSIRGPNAAAGVSAAAVFVTAEAVALLPSILSVVEEGVMVIIVVLTTLCMSPLMAILYLPLAWPVAWVLVSILRRICPERAEPASDFQIVKAVSWLEVWGTKPVAVEGIAPVLAADPLTLKARLDWLVEKGVLTWSAEAGYRVPPSN